MYRQLIFTALFLIIAGMTISSCRSRTDSEGYIILDNNPDPAILPYQFIEKDKRDHKKPERSGAIDLEGDGTTEFYEIQNNLVRYDNFTSILFSKVYRMDDVISHKNIKCDYIFNHFIGDITNDELTDFVVTYTIGDTLWVEAFCPLSDFRYRRLITVGKDRDNDGKWDGFGILDTLYDFNRDGNPEIMMHAEAGYDLYPRELFCIDHTNDTILWQYKIAGNAGAPLIFELSEENPDSIFIIYPIHSKANEASTATMDDKHAYIICFNARGEMQWYKEMGGAFQGSYIAKLYYGEKNMPALLASKVYSVFDQGREINAGALILYDLSGATLDSIDLGPERTAKRAISFDFNNDGLMEHYISLSDNTIEVYDDNLNILRKIKTESRVFPTQIGNLIGTDEKQMLLETSNSKIILVDYNFNPLALFPERGPVQLYNSKEIDGKQNIIFNTPDYSYNLAIEKTPWYTIFFRYPILAALTAFVPMLIIALLIFFFFLRMRQKNRVISTQRDKLDKTLKELRDTQEQLIAAEKYKQAKDIAGGFAHEIKNALLPAEGSLTMIRRMKNRDEIDSQKLSRFGENASQSVKKAIEITKLISEFTKLDSIKKTEDVILRETVEAVLEAYKNKIDEQNVKIDIQIDDQTCVRANRNQLEMVFANLLLNSLNALTGNVSGCILISCKSGTEFSTIVFSDNGSGIPEENLNRIFDAFYSTKPDTGIGLGLSMTKRIIELYDGIIAVESETGKGATFEIKLKNCR